MDGMIFIGVVAVVALWLLVTYNKFIRLGTQAGEALADIDVQLKRRFDLIPNLIETVKGYAKHEQGTLEKVIQARNSAMQASGGTDQKAALAAQDMLSGTLKSLFALSENYPDLKANTNFLELQRELSDTENKIQASRRFYNGSVRDLNIAVDSAPSNLVAKMFNFSKKEFFDLPDGSAATEPVKVQF
jgi:LemA protein